MISFSLYNCARCNFIVLEIQIKLWLKWSLLFKIKVKLRFWYNFAKHESESWEKKKQHLFVLRWRFNKNNTIAWIMRFSLCVTSKNFIIKKIKMLWSPVILKIVWLYSSRQLLLIFSSYKETIRNLSNDCYCISHRKRVETPLNSRNCNKL